MANMPFAQAKPSEALLASFGVPTLREVFHGPSKFVVDGVVPVMPKVIRCSAHMKMPKGMRCACEGCQPDLHVHDEDYFDFD